FSIYQKRIGTDRTELLIPPQPAEIFASDTSPDGHDLVYQRMNAKTGWDIWALPLGRDGKSVPVVQTDADERSARLSPDGRWVASRSLHRPDRRHSPRAWSRLCGVGRWATFSGQPAPAGRRRHSGADCAELGCRSVT